MKIPLINWLLLGSTIIIAIGVLLGTMFYNTIQSQLDEAEWVKQKHQTITQIITVEKLLVDMETGQRAFRNTGDQRFLMPYTLALTTIESSLQQLEKLVEADSLQTIRVNQIRATATSLLKLWNTPIAALSGSANLALTNQEKQFMDPIRQQLSLMQATEERHLVIREEALNDQVRKVTYRTVTGTALLFLVAAVLTYFYFLEFKSRRKVEDQLHQTVIELENLNHTSNDRNWLLSGQSAINDSLQRLHELNSVTEAVLKALTQYLNLPAAGFYCYNESDKTLELNTAIAFPTASPRFYALGEGLVGQAGAQGHLLITKPIPTEYWSIQSGSGQASPGQIACLPLLYGKELKGVIELARFTVFTELDIQLLNTVAKDIAVAINSVQSRGKILDLLT